MGLIGSGLTIICGHYGCGKTNLSINLAIDAADGGGRKTTLVDMDIVNPYFRSSDYADLLNSKGVKLIAPVYARSSIDLPMIAPEINGIWDSGGTVIIDVGGDGVGAAVLGRYADKIEAMGYDMLYVVNRYRNLSTTAKEAIDLMREIEEASHLRATGIVNNSHLMYDTVEETIAHAAGFAEETARAARLPLRGTVAPRFLQVQGTVTADYYVDIHVRPPWTYGT